MEISAYLFDAKGRDRQIRIDADKLSAPRDDQLLWINVRPRSRAALEKATALLGLEKVPFGPLLDKNERPKIEIFEDFYRFYIVAVRDDDNGRPARQPIDFLVGRNFVLTLHDEPVGFFRHFTELEDGETHIGELDAESFVAALLDLHIVSYFAVLEDIEEAVDRLDEKVLQTEIETDAFLAEMVGLRRRLSKLRRWFLPHREVFYGFSRPDFQQIAESDSAENFRLLTQHFESAAEAIENSRETLLGLFDLYATKSAQVTNIFIQRLTFLTLVIGTLGVLAGVLGMNFEADAIFKNPVGFWVALGGMVLTAVGLTVLARFKRWI